LVLLPLLLLILLTPINQERLVQRAFAAPDLTEDFEKEKQEAIEEEEMGTHQAKKMRANGGNSTTVEGWGSWAGLGAPAPPPPSITTTGRKRKGQKDDLPPPKRKPLGGHSPTTTTTTTTTSGLIGKREETGLVLKGKRKDDALPTVLISQKRDKRGAK